MDRKFVNYIYDQIDAAFVAINYRRPRRACCYYEISPNVYSWHGMPCDSRGFEAIYFMLNIGLHFRDIEETACRYSNIKYKTGEGVTIMDTFHSVLGEKYRYFTFDPTEPELIKPEIERIIHLVQQFAIPWYRKNNNIESVTEYLKARVNTLGFYPERYAAALSIQGKDELLSEFIEEHRESVKKYGPSIVSDWEQFSRNFKPT